MQQTKAAFPAGLYGMLLIAVFGLTLPALFAPVERVLVGSAALVPRFLGHWSGEPVAAAGKEDLARLQNLRADLDAAVRHHDVYGAESLMPAGWRPLVCSAVATGRRGGAGQPSVVRLDRTYAEVRDCSEFVTKGDALLGFLLRPGVGIAAKDRPEDFARVQLLNDRAARSVAAGMAFPQGGTLRMIVGPAARVDAAALRAELWDDPYRASSMKESGYAVHTLRLAGVANEPPGGLLLGRTVIWGYDDTPDGAPLTIGVLVAPPVDPQALSHVVLWRGGGAGSSGVEATGHRGSALPPSARAAELTEHPATVWDLPGARGRHLVACDASIPDGAAVVQDGLFLGTARGLSFGLGLVSSFALSRQRWSLLLLPHAPEARPREIVAEVLEGQQGRALLRCSVDRFLPASEGLTEGYLFTGSNGRHCPAGLWLGTARPVPGWPEYLEVTLPVMRGPRAASVLVQDAIPEVPR